MAMTARVNRILPRRSGILIALTNADSIELPLLAPGRQRHDGRSARHPPYQAGGVGGRLVALLDDDFHGATGGGDPVGGRRGEGMRLDPDTDRDVAAAEHLDRGVLAGQAEGHEAVGVDLAPVGQGLGQAVEVDHRPLDPVAGREALELGDAALERELAALEADADLGAGLGALGAPAGRLALAGRLAPALAHALG